MGGVRSFSSFSKGPGPNKNVLPFSLGYVFLMNATQPVLPVQRHPSEEGGDRKRVEEEEEGGMHMLPLSCFKWPVFATAQTMQVGCMGSRHSNGIHARVAPACPSASPQNSSFQIKAKPCCLQKVSAFQQCPRQSPSQNVYMAI